MRADAQDRRALWARESADWPHREASRFVESGGLPWHVQVLGEAQTQSDVLLLHGTGAASHSWRDVAPRLAEGARVIVPDLPGHGFSGRAADGRADLPWMAQAVAGLLRELHASPTLVIGHSAGAAIAARMCLDGLIAPDRLVAINGAWLPFGGLLGRMFSPAARILAGSGVAAAVFARLARDPSLARRLLQDTGSRVDEAGLQRYQQLLRLPEHVAGALAMMAQWELSPLLADLPALSVPLLMIVGANDRTVPPSQSEAVHRRVPGSALRVLPGLGHLAHEEDPVRVIGCLEGTGSD